MPTTPSVPATRSDTEGLPTLVAQDLACRRGNRLLFKGVNFSVGAGQAVWLRGRNGRGKTSLLRLAAGLSSPESGSIRWGDVPVRKAVGLARRMVYVGHTSALKDDLSVTEALRFLALLHGRDSDAGAMHRALDRVGMSTRRDAPVRTLSQGQRRRATLARLALEREASIWILDEPYDALDVDGVECVNALLHANLARGGSVLLTSHQASGASAPPMTPFDLDPFA
ncbi:MAG: cytochrome c biogenesis heme-transporting ATPase CcmA [Burkholderiaceae bacterium]|nr:cytochrome c biogenesis heme-transporting ATPase CcmA [Burkholderiaceae bacterium]